MKAKKLMPILALVLGLSSFASCTQGNQTVELAPYWQKDANNAYVALVEELTYNVTFQKESGLDSVGYDVNYVNGTYTTTLKQKEDYTYEYTTTFAIDVVYTLDGQDPVTKKDSVTTKVQFKATTDSLQPTHSEKTIKCHTPLLVTKPTSAAKCYYVEEYSIVTDYADGKGTAVKTDLTKVNPEETLPFKQGKKYTYLDNEQLPFAFRAFSTDVTSAKIKKYCPFTEAMQTIAISFGSEEESAYSFKTPVSVNVNGEAKTLTSAAYRIATMKIDAQNSGVSKKVYIATKSKDRNLIIKMETPLSYSFGTLVYELTSVKRTENN